MSSNWTYRGWFSGVKRNRNRIPISISKNSIEDTEAIIKMSTAHNSTLNSQPDLIDQFKKINLNESDKDLNNNNVVKQKPMKAPPPVQDNFFFKRTHKKKSQSDESTKSKSRTPKLVDFLAKQKRNLLNCCDETPASLSKSSSLSENINNLKSNEKTRLSPDDLSSILEKKKKEWSKLNSNLVDSHCHFEMIFNKLKYDKSVEEYFEDYDEYYFKNFECCINVVCDPYKYSKRAWLISSLRNFRHPKVFNTIGCHPHFGYAWSDHIENLIVDACKNPLNNIIAIGECGLDMSRKNSVNLEHQKKVFEAQLKIAKDLNLPVVIHCRNAEQEAYDILKKNLESSHKIHLHCFTGQWKIASMFLDSFPNLCIGVTPLVSYSESVREVALKIQLDRLLLETDAPYFYPNEFPSCYNACSHPGFVYFTAESVALLREISINEVLDSNRANVKKVYSI